MDMEFDIALVIAFLEHSVVEDVRYLRDLTWRVHNWHLLHDANWSLCKLLLVTD